MESIIAKIILDMEDLMATMTAAIIHKHYAKKENVCLEFASTILGTKDLFVVHSCNLKY